MFGCTGPHKKRCIYTQHVLGLVFGCTGPRKKRCDHTQHVLGLVIGCTGLAGHWDSIALSCSAGSMQTVLGRCRLYQRAAGAARNALRSLSCWWAAVPACIYTSWLECAPNVKFGGYGNRAATTRRRVIDYVAWSGHQAVFHDDLSRGLKFMIKQKTKFVGGNRQVLLHARGGNKTRPWRYHSHASSYNFARFFE